jgi:hypothetical protein
MVSYFMSASFIACRMSIFVQDLACTIVVTSISAFTS